jgi:hypothetical protein
MLFRSPRTVWGEVANLECGGRAQRRHRFSQFSETEESSRPMARRLVRAERGEDPSREARRRLTPVPILPSFGSFIAWGLDGIQSAPRGVARGRGGG